MPEVLTERKPISEVLAELEDEDLRVYAWRLYSLERAGFAVAPAVQIAKDKNIDLRQAERMKEQGCPDNLVALILT